ncbi:erythrocyte membrane protein 1, PfEMP1, putative [Plasmodium sp. gorilla clade G1]|nr:erythrocyte membrane protein 1, PfEMP1, putative [Plasmodium sp. gorilla clade G1]
MDSTSTIANKIEKYLEGKSNESNIDQSLRADPSEIDYYNFGGDGGYLRKNICKITVNHSDSGTNDPCNGKAPPYGDNGQWKCDKNLSDPSEKHKVICVPHRRERLCTYNLEKLNVEKIRDNNAFLADVLLTARNEGEKIILNHPDTNSSNVCVALERSFADLADIIRGTDQLRGVTNNILKQMLKKIQADDRIPQDKYPKKDQNYRKLREAWWNANRQKVWEVITCGARSNDLLIKREWTTSGKSNGENKLQLFRKCGHYEEKVPTQLDYVPQFLRWLTEWIEDFYRQKQNVIDGMENHCEECTTEDGKCKVDTPNSSTCKEKCKKYCECVKKWTYEWENEKNKYTELYKKPNENSRPKKNTSSYDDYVNDVFKKLEGDNYKSLDKYIKDDPYSKEYATKLSFILNSSDAKNVSGVTENNNYEASNCNESEIASFVESPTSGLSSEKACNTHSSIQPYKKKECKHVKLGVSVNDNNLKICVIEDTSLSGVENCCCQNLLGMLQETCSDNKQPGSSSNGNCDNYNQKECQKKLEEVLSCLQKGCKCKQCKSRTSKTNDKKWIWRKFSGNGEGLQEEYANTIGLPPRTQLLYLGNLHEKEEKKQENKNISANSELLKEWIIGAFHEGKNLKNSTGKKNGGNNTKLCKALAYSFADYGDLIKGTSIWDNEYTKDLELNLQKTFGKLFRKYIKKNTTEQPTSYSSLDELRESWWNTNKKYIWLAMKYGAEMNSTMCNGGNSGVSGTGDNSGGASGVSVSTTCSGDNVSSCDDMPTVDLIPQYLRFLQEWIEHFCEQRQGKVNDVIDSCKSCKDKLDEKKIGGKCDSDCNTKCKSKCEAYKKFIEECGVASGGGDGTAGSPWSKRWDQVYKRYSKHIEDAKRNLEAGTKTCGTATGANKCVQSDIDSFFKHLIDIGLTTPSSYLSIVLDDKICGADNAPWTKYTTYATTIKKRDCDKNRSDGKKREDDNTPVDIIVPSPLGNTPYEYKYACECRTPNKQESCDDRKEYVNQWHCGSAQIKKPGSRKDDYESCKYNGVQVTPQKKSDNTKIDDNDVTFFNWFDLWYEQIQNEIDQYTNKVETSCNFENTPGTSISGQEGKNKQQITDNDNIEKFKNCQENCECYNLWSDKVREQWEKQKNNYKNFEDKQKRLNEKNKAHVEKSVSLNDYIFYKCWRKYLKNNEFIRDIKVHINHYDDFMEFFVRKCGVDGRHGKTQIEERIKGAKNKTNELLNKNNGTGHNKTLLKCDRIDNVYGVQPKNYDGFMSPGKGGEKQWICKDTLTHGHINVCIPPRNQQLCINSLWGYYSTPYGSRSVLKINNNDSQDKLKGKLKSAMKKETELLYEYHDKGTAIISKNPMKEEEEGKDKKEEKQKEIESNNTNRMPKGFCHAVQRSFNDYKYLVLGKSIYKPENVKKIEDKIGEIIRKNDASVGKKQTDSIIREKWWKEIENDMWDGVKCGIKTISEQKKNSKINCDECGIFPPTGNDSDQFVSWFKEWGEQFCIERLQYNESIRKACNNNVQGKEIQRECKLKCEEYQTYISEKKEEWDKQKTKYENKYVGKSASDLLKENYPECISANFDFIFNDNVEYKTYYPYGDYSSICSCEEVKYNEYKKDKGQNNKSLCREKCNDMTWSKKYIKKLENGRSLEGVYVPPRRQQLCLYEIFPIIIKENKNDTENVKKELLETLKIVAEREAYYLWKQYHANNDATYLAHKKACCAIRASFYDLGDIIKGNDLVHDEYTKYIDTTLNKIFGGSNNNNDIETKRSRRDWWENETINVANETDHKTRRQLVWYAMQSGVRYAIKEENEKKKQKKVETEQSDQKGDQESDTLPLCMVVEHIGIAKPQFIRWLEEWTNEFCEEYTTYFRAINSNCKNTTGPNDCGDNSNIACKKACTNYTNWLNPKRIEWTGMSNYYNKIYRKSNKESEDGEDYSMIMAPTVIQYLNKRCDGDINGNYICCSCKDIGENKKPSTAQKQKVPKKKDEDEEEKGPLDLMNEVLNKMDEKYSKHKMKCTEIYLEHIEEQLKEIDNAIKDYKLYPLDRCFDDKSKMKVCDLIGDAIGCKNKTKLDELDEWNDVDMRDPYNKHKGVLIPPRRRQLCFSSIVRGPKNIRNLNEFKKEILKGALSEGKFLGNYYNDDKEKEKKEDRKEKVLEAMKNSFYDYEDIIKGSDMLQNIEYKDIKLKLEKLLDKETNNKQNAEAWWKANNKSIWNAMLCGYNKSGKKIIDPSWCTIPTTEKTPQFLRWIKEWGTNVCIQKEKYKKNVKSECSNVTNLRSQESESTKCIPEITKYQEWSRKRFFQWEGISERYNKDKKSFRNVNQPDANAYLKEHCSKCRCGFNDMKEINNNEEDQEDIFNRIKEKVKIPAELEDVIYRIKHHEYNSNNYICNKYNNKKNIHHGMQHKNAITWADNFVKKSWEINKDILIPPRRKNLFLKIDTSQICQYKKNPEMFKDFIYWSAFTEVERLKKAYGEAKAKVAQAMKYSFADIGSIIKGNDMMDKNQSDNIRKILGDGDGQNEKRRKWWDWNKYHIWESMLCGYKNAYRNISDVDKKLLDTLNIDEEHQFLRWFTEWAEDFCIKQKEQLTRLGEQCKFGTCDDATPAQKSACQLSCNTYKKFLNKWEKEYVQHYSIYNSLQDTVLLIKNKEPYEYLNDSCRDRCSCLHKRDGTPVNNAFVYPPKEVEGKCPCPIKRATISNTETITTIRTKKEKSRQLYTDNHLEKCPFENSGDGNTTVINNDRCKNLNVQHSCVLNKYENNLDQWKGSIVKNMSGENNGVLVPPRRRHLCKTPFIRKIYRSNDEDIFRNDFYIAMFNQGYLLGTTFKNYNEEGYKALKNSFADYGDIVKGTDMLETTTHTDIKTKLEKLLKNAQNTDEPNGIPSKPKDANDWWKTNKTKVWHAMLCGYHQGVNRPPIFGRRRGTPSQQVTAPTSSATTKTIPSNWCTVPTDDSTDQFLRWLKEWGTQYCKEKEQLKSDINLECKSHLDKYAIIENKKYIHPKCLEKLQKYEVWSNNRLPQWKELSEKFTKDIDDKKYTNVEEKSADTYLPAQCSECKCSFNDIEQTHEKSENAGHDIYVDILDKAQIPSSLEDKAYRYKGRDPKCPEENECSQYENIPCEVLLHDDNKDWESTFVKNNNTTNKGVLVPPRRRQLCLRIDLKMLRQLKKGEENFKKFICSCAFAEAKRLKKVYKQDYNKLLQAMKYSFADIGNIVKGDDMMESPTFRYIEEIFSDMKYKGIDRTKWWNKNKYDAWKSMLCGYKKAGGNLPEKSENCRFPDTEAVPQFLRWFQEWTENFCAGRKKLYDKLNSECTSVECTNESVDKSKCSHACEKYKNYVLSKKKEYEIQKNKYNAEFKNKYVIVKDALDYFKNKCKNNCDCLSKNFSDDNKWNEPYNTFDDDLNLKSKCECAKSETERDAKPCTIPDEDVKSQEGESEAAAVDGLLDKIKENFWPFVSTAGIVGISGTYKAIDEAAPVIISEGTKYGGKAVEVVTPVAKKAAEVGIPVAKKAAEVGIPVAKNAVTQFFDKLTELINPSGDGKSPDGEIQHRGRGKIQRPLLPPPPPPIFLFIPRPSLMWGKKDKKKTMCEIVGEILKGKNENSPIEGCHPKNNDNYYPGWQCDQQSGLMTENGICMPPRRQELCLHYLKEAITDTEELKNAFVKCAAAETFLLWQKYKKDMNGSAENLHEKLQSGTIPEDFKHQMFYTFGDYRDLCLNTDISSKIDERNDVSIVKMNIDDFFLTIRQGSHHHRKNWWERHGPTIWEGMVCALTNEITEEEKKKQIKDNYSYKNLKKPQNGTSSLEDFAKTPQFFRWFIEWSEDYCRNYKKQLDILQEACSKLDCKHKVKQKKKECKDACEEFNTFVNEWKDQYRQQKVKFDSEKMKKENEGTYSDIRSKEAYEYLKDNCLDRKCECIEKVSEDNINNVEKIPSVFDTPPKDYIKICSCAPNESACENDELPRGRSEYQMECQQLKEIGGIDRTTIHEIKKKDLVEEHSPLQIVDFKLIYFPPRVKQLCLKNIGNLSDSVDEKMFVTELQKDAYNEAKQLYEYYAKEGKDFINITGTKETDEVKDIRKHTIENMKRSYADYADLIKGKTKYKLYDNYNHIHSIIENVVNSDSFTSGNKNKREALWEKYKADVWNAMLCGYNEETNKTINEDDDICNLPNTDNEEQFERWFTEWAENFCLYKKSEETKLKKSCNFTECNKESDKDKKECHALCKKYKNWIEEKQNQYENQKKTYEDEYMNKKNPNKDINQFLTEQCKNKCDCISNNTSGDNKDKVFEEYPENAKIACNCPTLPGSSNKGSPFGDLLNIKNVIEKRPYPKNDSNDIIRHSEENEYSTKSKNSTLSHMSCIEKAAYKMKEFDEKNIKDIYGKLKGDGLNFNDDCKLVDETIVEKDGFKEIYKDKLDEKFPSKDYSCENENIKRFEIEQTWNCNNINRKYLNICLPPRRQYICLKRIKEMSSRYINSKDDLLKEIMKAAKEEGIDILKKLKTDRSTEFYKICDAMKYSFADIGDIIRGKDMWNNNRNEDGLQVRLKSIFWNIYSTLEPKEKKRYDNDLAHFYKLRSDWWNANRKEIWKAMTCAAPKTAYFRKTEADGIGISSLILPYAKCGRDNDPPIVDYIPQRLRWISEWSEYFCNLLNKEIDEMNNQCKDCEMSRTCNDTEGGKCIKCKEQCQKFKTLVSKWKNQFGKQSMEYKELYKKASSDTSIRNSSVPERGYGRNHRRRGYDDDTNVQLFLKKLLENNECKVESLGKYLDKTSYCGNYNFNYDSTPGSNRPNAFEITPEKFKKACKCKIPNSLEKCPYEENKNVCKRYKNVSSCTSLFFKDDVSEWNISGVKDKENDNNRVLVPPRRRKLCINLFSKKDYKMKDENDFKEDLLNAAFSEGKLLGRKYINYSNEAYEAMKLSFADYSDIVKGTDMMNDLNKLNEELDTLLKETENGDISVDRKTWWDDNKNSVWNAMLCGYRMENIYQQLNSSWCTVPDDDNTDQFLRWLKEWGRQACKEKKRKARIVLEKCNNAHLTEDQKKNPSSIISCKNATEDYMQWIHNTTESWKILSNKYENDKTNKKDDTYKKIPFTSAKDYLKIRSNDCDCNLDDFDETHNAPKGLTDDMIINAINKAKRDLPNGGWGIYWDNWRYPTWNKFGWSSIMLPDISFQWIHSVNGVIEKVSKQIQKIDDSLSSAISIGKDAREKTAETAKTFLDKALQIRDEIIGALDNMEHETETNNLKKNTVPELDSQSSKETSTTQTDGPLVGPAGPKESSLFQNDYSSLAPLFHLLTFGTPLRIGFLLGSVAFLIFYLKKKPKLRPSNLFRVIDVPQNDYDMPTTKSSNRYVPYESSRYKGKTYIYMEGEETDDYSYIRDISSSDITSSSESEYEELDINDIYVSSLPKYKTLIEVVLEPSKRDIFNTPSGDTFTNKLTDDEWNQLKQDFIEQNLTHIGSSLPLYNELPDDNMYMDTQPNILHDSMDEKPFITQIQDRFLDSSHEEVTYNIDWNVPENINRITNIMDDPKYSSNNMYTGTDLINDSLNGNQHMDIYDEMLKRKENELFGTNHTQNTTFNSVSKQTPGDPIINQLDLYHKWMDKHRDICEQWKTKEDMLYKLNEVWNMERKEYLLDIQPSTLDDIHKINDETYNIISTNNIYDHPSQETPLQLLGSTNIIPSYITTEQNNGLCTNISMDTHIDEKNYNNVVTTSIIGDDQVENSYNFG